MSTLHKLLLCTALLHTSAYARPQKNRDNPKAKTTQDTQAEQPHDHKQRNAFIGGGILFGGCLLIYLYYNQKPPLTLDNALEQYQAYVKKNNANTTISGMGGKLAGSDLYKKLTVSLPPKAHTPWKTWILEEKEILTKGLAMFLLQNDFDITKKSNSGSYAISALEHDLIDGGTTPRSTAYILAHYIHLINKIVPNDDAFKECINYNNDEFLARLVDRHGSNTQKLDTQQDDGHSRANCSAAIYVMIRLGGANPENRPQFGSQDTDSYPFFKGIKTIQQVASEKGDTAKLVFSQTNNTWDVHPAPSSNTV